MGIGAAGSLPMDTPMKPRGNVACATAVRILAAFLVSFPAVALDQGKDDRVVRFGGSAYYPPFEWLDGSGRPRGFLIDLKEAVAREGGRRPVHRLSEWSESIEALDRSEVDVVPMFHSDARARDYLLTEPIYYVMHAIYGRPARQGVSGPESLDGMRVAVVASGFAEDRLRELGDGARLVPKPNIEEALRAVAGNEADVALVARPTAARFIGLNDFDLRALGPPFWPRKYVFAVAPGRRELFDWLEGNLSSVMALGRYHDVYARWESELEWTRPGLVDQARRVALYVVPLMVIAALGYLWSWQLRRRVAERTRELNVELTRRQAAEEELRYRARHDALTDLPTRSEFVRLSERAVAERGQVDAPAVIATVRLVDLDRIISAFGYETGEQLLGEFGHRLSEMSFEVVGDFGRGVFGVLVLEEMEPRQVLKELTAPIDLGQLELDPHFSIGIARFPEHGTMMAELVRKAETALAEAAARSRMWVEYEPGLEPKSDDLIIVRDFRRVSAGELYPVFQPLIDLESLRVVGAEALLRWRHPEFGLISPERFIPLLESAGVVYRVTRYMVREAIRVGVGLRGHGLNLPISVNVSAVDLIEGNLRQLISDCLSEHGVGPEVIQLEMTETSVIGNPDRAAEVVAGLGEMGVRCGIDDFGAGYSSLAYLSQFPIQEVKIDRSFVTDMRINERHGAIVRSVIALAHELKLAVVAEGAEDWPTVAALRRQGCDRVQGFIFSEPVAEDELVSLGGRVFEPGRDDGQGEGSA